MKTLKILFLLFGLLASELCLADSISLNALKSFADQNSYRDNRNSIEKEKIYAASKNCCGHSAYSIIEAYPDKKGFKQVALWCDHCGIKKISTEQIDLCRTEFKNLHKSITNQDPSESLLSLIGTDGKGRQKTSNANTAVRFSTGFLKCDTQGGSRVRIDYFFK